MIYALSTYVNNKSAKKGERLRTEYGSEAFCHLFRREVLQRNDGRLSRVPAVLCSLKSPVTGTEICADRFRDQTASASGLSRNRFQILFSAEVIQFNPHTDFICRLYLFFSIHDGNIKQSDIIQFRLQLVF